MAVRLLFPTFMFHRNLLQEDYPEDVGISQEYVDLLVNEVDQMRHKDPKGRQISNAYTGWQSNDGCERSPVFRKLINRIEKTFADEVLPFHGITHESGHRMKVEVGNMWANVNDKLAWNKPHLHNGCWYSGVFYIKADGDEGDFSAVETDVKVVSDFPSCQRTPNNFNIAPTTGELVLFPSALMHMVEPNRTDKDRYSCSFNCVIKNHGDPYHGEIQDWDADEFCFDIDVKGNPVFRSSK
tara:strand:- start:111 stop:830 length:720 start_codon:yes stop_codon:yes gene_type:complete